MRPESDHAGLVALLRADRRWWRDAAGAIERAGSVECVLDEALGLLAGEARARAATEIAAWCGRGIELLSALDDSYPAALRAATAPPLLFVNGRLTEADDPSVAGVGTRRPSRRGRAATTAVVRLLIEAGTTVVSGLAAGIDAAAHVTALGAGGRTIAVVGCGLDHCHPPGHAALQRQIAGRGAVVSQFWPEVPPSRTTFPMRNGVMAALTRATVIVEASETSGTRIQARLALADRRPVLLLAPVMGQPWAQELATQPGVTVAETTREVADALAVCITPAQTATPIPA